MLIIVEGPDRAGKSTLITALRSRIEKLHPRGRVGLLHAGPPKRHPLDEYEQPLFSYRPDRDIHIICDRWHIGEQVYPIVFNRKTNLTLPAQAHIEAFLRSRGAVLIYVYADPDTLHERFDAGAQNGVHGMITWSQLLTSHHLFQVEARTSLLSRLEINTTVSYDVDVVLDQIYKWARDAEMDASSLNGVSTYVGPPRPRLLLVGDVRHAYAMLDRDPSIAALAATDPSPAFMPYQTTSGTYLLETVDPFTVWGDIGLINACDVDDAHQAWKILGEPIAVALGRRAWNATKTWARGAAPHPQHVRRFYHEHMQWYRTLLARVMVEGGDRVSERPSGMWSDRERGAKKDD